MSLFFPSYDHIPSLATAHAHLEHQKAEAKASHKRVTSMPLILDKDLQLLSAVPSTPQNAMSEVDHLAAPAALRGAAMDPMVAPGGVSAEQTDSSQAALIDNKKLVKRLQRNLVGSWECLSCTLTPIPTQDNNAESSEIVHVLTEKPNGNLIYTSDGWMSALLQKPASLLPKYTASSIGGTDEESAAVARGTQPYAGMYGIDEESVRLVSNIGGEDGGDTGVDYPRGYLSQLRKSPRTEYVRFKLYHDIKMGMPVNWIGQKQVRVGEMWEEEEKKEQGEEEQVGDEDGRGKPEKRKRLYVSLGAEFPVMVDGRQWKVEGGYRKRS